MAREELVLDQWILEKVGLDLANIDWCRVLGLQEDLPQAH